MIFKKFPRFFFNPAKNALKGNYGRDFRADFLKAEARRVWAPRRSVAHSRIKNFAGNKFGFFRKRSPKGKSPLN